MKKILSFIISFCLLFSMVACSDTGGSNPGGDTNNNTNETPTNPGDNPTPQSGFEVIFFDIENGSDGTHYDGVNNDGTVGYSGVKPADCYMIKTGNTEILVDAGFQLQTPLTDALNQRISKVYQENVIKKIESYCTDGTLEYLIVTHGDYDHLIGLAVDGGILDYFYNNNKKINTIIDFDSDLVTYLSNPDGNDIFPSGYNNFFSGSTIIDAYRAKRDLFVKEKQAVHLPAASFFKGTDFLKDNTLVNSMPNEYLKKYFVLDQLGEITDQINTSFLSNFYYFSDDVIYHSQCDEITKQPEESNLKFESIYDDLNINIGTLENENERYYFSIQLENNVELKILYNWFYDHFYKHSFTSADRNNISVCFEISAGETEFLSFGDLGSGESGVINYYKNTSVLKDIDCFKASHHGSTGNGENSKELFELIKAKIVIVPGVAQISRTILNASNLQTDPIFSGLSTTAVMEQKFFDNVLSGRADAQIYCTQIARLLKAEKGFSLVAGSLYGDVSFKTYGNTVTINCSNKGEIEGYVSGVSEKAKHFSFTNQRDGELLSFNETEYYKAIYESKGRVE